VDLFLQQRKVRDYEIHGISIVARQIRLAGLRCRKLGAAKTEFLVGDCLHLPYESGYFDGIVAIETFCHIPRQDKSQLLQSCIRVLTPGGRLVILDGYLARQEKTAEEEYWLGVLRNGWTLPELITAEEMSNLAIASGFDVENSYDAPLSQVRPSVQLIYRLCRYIFWPLLQLYKVLKDWGTIATTAANRRTHSQRAAPSSRGLAQKELLSGM
jgi:SAM-dependent methyltransferase